MRSQPRHPLLAESWVAAGLLTLGLPLIELGLLTATQGGDQLALPRCVESLAPQRSRAARTTPLTGGNAPLFTHNWQVVATVASGCVPTTAPTIARLEPGR
jgi:hypothetical protein